MPLYPIHLHQWLDVQDSENDWLEANVIGVEEAARTFRIHYKGWHAKFDETLSSDPSHPQAARYAPLHTHTKPKLRHGKVPMRVNTYCDILDTADKWIRGLIVDIDPDHQLVKVRYFGWSPKFDEWIPMYSYRFAPEYLFTPRPIVQAPRRPMSQIRPPSNDQEDRFNELLKQHHGFRIVVQASDGNCLFRSVSHQVYGNAEYHQMVREKCMMYITSEREFFSGYIAEQFEEYVERMMRDGEWGDHVEIQALSELYNRPVEIYAYSPVPMRTYQAPSTSSSLSPPPPIRLSYHFQSHYNSVVHDPTHHLHLLNTPPGEVEEAFIQKSREGGGTGLNRHAPEDGDDNELRLALDVSRHDFKSAGAPSLSELEQVIQMSLVQQQPHQGVDDVHGGDSDMKRAIEASIAESKAESNAWESFEELKSEGGAGGVGGSGSGSASHHPKREAAISSVVEFGFDRTQAESAFDKVADTRIDTAMAIENMLQYLMR